MLPAPWRCDLMVSASFHSYPSPPLLISIFPSSLLDFACRRSVIHVILLFRVFFVLGNFPRQQARKTPPPFIVSSSPFVITIKFSTFPNSGVIVPIDCAALILKKERKKESTVHLYRQREFSFSFSVLLCQPKRLKSLHWKRIYEIF